MMCTTMHILCVVKIFLCENLDSHDEPLITAALSYISVTSLSFKLKCWGPFTSTELRPSANLFSTSTNVINFTKVWLLTAHCKWTENEIDTTHQLLHLFVKLWKFPFQFQLYFHPCIDGACTPVVHSVWFLHPEQLLGPTNLLSNGYQVSFPRGKEANARSWLLTSM